MSNEISENLLNDLVSVSETMVTSASEGRWDNLAALDQRRRQLLDELSEQGHAFDPGRFSLASQTLSRLDQQLLQIVRDARDQTAIDHKTLQNNREAVSSYQMAETPAA